MVLGLLDPSGVVAFALSGLPSLWMTTTQYEHSREHEREADATGLSIMARACFRLDASHVFMRKLHAGGAEGEKAHAAWFDTHPSGPERVAALEAQAKSIAPGDDLLKHCVQTKQRLKGSMKALWG